MVSWSRLKRWAYRFKVTLGSECPSMFATISTFAPAEIALDAAVCLISCGVTLGTPAISIADLNTRLVKFASEIGLPTELVNTKSDAALCMIARREQRKFNWTGT